jgi:uncharacterized membrane protein YbhN (UPF0104 family)
MPSVRAITREIAPAAGADSRSRPMARLAWMAGGMAFAALLTLHSHDFIHAFSRALGASWELLALGALLEAASVAGYVFLLHRVVASASPQLRFKDSYDMALAGTAATRLLPTAGLGGAAVTVWALRARGLRMREVSERLLAFMLLLYAVYMAALLIDGTLVASGLVHVSHGRELGVVAALIGSGVVVTFLVLSAAPGLLSKLVARGGSSRWGATAQRAEAHLPVLRTALKRAANELRRPHPALLGALAWWAFDIGVLATMLHAFGIDLPVPGLVLAYFLGTMFNVLPLPGSLSGGLIGVVIAFGAPAGAAIAAVLAYRSVAVWLPAASGVRSLFSLRSSVARWRQEAASA